MCMLGSTICTKFDESIRIRRACLDATIKVHHKYSAPESHAVHHETILVSHSFTEKVPLCDALFQCSLEGAAFAPDPLVGTYVIMQHKLFHYVPSLAAF